MKTSWKGSRRMLVGSLYPTHARWRNCILNSKLTKLSLCRAARYGGTHDVHNHFSNHREPWARRLEASDVGLWLVILVSYCPGSSRSDGPGRVYAGFVGPLILVIALAPATFVTAGYFLKLSVAQLPSLYHDDTCLRCFHSHLKRLCF